MDRLLLIDGNSLLNRAFFAMPLLTAPNGTYTNAVYGFLNMFYSALEQCEPTHIMVAFDRREPTFRHKEYKDYKAGRKPMPDELIPQFPLLRETLTRMNVPTCDLVGYEADDLLGTLSRISDENGGTCVILSGDKDTLQLISEQTTVWITTRGLSETEKFDGAHLKEVYGLVPAQITDLKGLMGDSSDHIPGVAGIGEKTALKLLGEYGTVEHVLEHAGEIKGKLGERLQAGAQDACMSKRLATIDRNAPIPLTMEELRYTPAPAAELAELFRSLSFKSLLNKLPQEAQEISQAAHYCEIEILAEEAELEKLKLELSRAETIYVYADDGAVYLSIDEAKEYKLPLRQTLIDEGFDEQTLYGFLPEVLTAKPIVAYDAKHLYHRVGQVCGVLRADVKVAEYLLDSLKNETDFESMRIKYGADGFACALRVFAQAQLQELERLGMLELYREIELPLEAVLYEMEQRGFCTSEAVLRAIGAELKEKADLFSSEIFSLSGEEFNINSPKQLGDILFEKLGLPHGRKTKNGYSTDIEVLEQLRGEHPIIENIIAYRQAQKLKSTYTDAMLGMIDAGGRIHSTFQQTVTATGRLSSAEPNLQNIPVRTEQGRLLRKAFVAPAGEWVLVDGDYSQIELRILAHMSQDENMIAAFLGGHDIHTETAAEVFGVAAEQVTAAQRSAAKAVNFGIVYGISDFGLAQNLGIPRKEAAEYIASYLAHYQGIKAFMEECVQQAKAGGYARTLYGRLRPMPELRSSNYNVRSFGQRAAMNMPVQGTAADIMKIAMLRCEQALKEKKMQTRLILQVHDELILEAPECEKQAAMLLLRECMEGAAELHVPLLAEVKCGKSWFDTK